MTTKAQIERNETRAEALARFNEINDDNIDMLRDYELPAIADHAPELLKLANHQETIIEQMREALLTCKEEKAAEYSGYGGLQVFDECKVESALTLADAPYGETK